MQSGWGSRTLIYLEHVFFLYVVSPSILPLYRDDIFSLDYDAHLLFSVKWLNAGNQTACAQVLVPLSVSIAADHSSSIDSQATFVALPILDTPAAGLPDASRPDKPLLLASRWALPLF